MELDVAFGPRGCYLGRDDTLLEVSQKYLGVKMYPRKHSKPLSKSVNDIR